jgi:mannose-6-phosphate isomerase-like protein (cupin superfamily)
MPMNAAELAKLNPEEKEAYHQSIEAQVKVMKYEPTTTGEPKDIIPLIRTKLGRMAVQVVHEGGENNLHYHLNSDTTWYVLQGRVKFYGPGDAVIADLGSNEMISIPGGARYWFETSGDEDLQILQCVFFDSAGEKPSRVNVESHKEWMKDAELQVYEPAAAH